MNDLSPIDAINNSWYLPPMPRQAWLLLAVMVGLFVVLIRLRDRG